MKMLFICENPHEVDSLLPVAKLLKEMAGDGLEYEFASMDAYLFQGVDGLLAAAGVPCFSLPAPRPLARPLPQLGAIGAMKTILTAQKQLRRLADHYDAIFIGVDVWMARVIVNEARAQGKPTFQLVNSWLALGLPRPAGRAARIKRQIRRVLGALLGPDSPLAATEIFKCGCDRVFVAGEKGRQVLADEGVQNLVVSGMPRYADLKKAETTGLSRSHGQKPFTILYLPGAWAWHGLTVQHHRQQQQLQLLVEWLAAQPADTYRLLVKNHPREKSEYYDWLTEYPFVQFLPMETPLPSLWPQSDAMICMFSQAIIESIWAGCPALLCTFPTPLEGVDSLEEAAALSLPFARTVPECAQLLEQLRCDPARAAALLASERDCLETLISSHTADSVRLIAEEVLGVLRTRQPAGPSA
jgi:hypothetical protein